MSAAIDGLALKVKKSGTRSWALRIAVAGRCREMGLGSFPSVTLAEAREKARLYRAQVIEGHGPHCGSCGCRQRNCCRAPAE